MIVYKISCRNSRLPRTSALFMDTPVFRCTKLKTKQNKKTTKFSILWSRTKNTYFRKQNLLCFSFLCCCESVCYKKYLKLQSVEHFLISPSPKSKLCTEWWHTILFSYAMFMLLYSDWEYKEKDDCHFNE